MKTLQKPTWLAMIGPVGKIGGMMVVKHSPRMQAQCVSYLPAQSFHVQHSAGPCHQVRVIIGS